MNAADQKRFHQTRKESTEREGEGVSQEGKHVEKNKTEIEKDGKLDHDTLLLACTARAVCINSQRQERQSLLVRI